MNSFSQKKWEKKINSQPASETSVVFCELCFVRGNIRLLHSVNLLSVASLQSSKGRQDASWGCANETVEESKAT